MSKPLDPLVSQLNASLSFDRRLFQEDIDASQAWARALARVGLLDEHELESIAGGLEQVRAEMAAGSFAFAPSDEDIHTAVERRLTEIVGAPGGKLHTGRSRNDQVATDFRLWILRACGRLQEQVRELAGALLQSAEQHPEILMPGYTHLQPAQAITWSHWILAHFWALRRDHQRLLQTAESCAWLPLGSAALAGTAFPIDRLALAQDLGFSQVSPNSLDAVSDRDFALEFLFTASTLGIHLSRLAEALILFSSAEFGFLEIDEAYLTGSSLMPQKRNADPLELARGKSGRLIGSLVALLTTLKGLPSAYDKDLQEDKPPVLDAFDTLEMLLPVMAGLVRSLRLNEAAMAERLVPEILATDLADYLVGQGVPFRQAHDLVGQAVRLAQQEGTSLDRLSARQFQSIDSRLGDDLSEVFDLRASLERRTAAGGVSRAARAEQMRAARQALATMGEPR